VQHIDGAWARAWMVPVVGFALAFCFPGQHRYAQAEERGDSVSGRGHRCRGTLTESDVPIVGLLRKHPGC
jgi:hypothetical protein